MDSGEVPLVRGEWTLGSYLGSSLPEASRTALRRGSTVSGPRERPPLRIRPERSLFLAVFLLGAYGAAFAVVFTIPLGWYWRAALAAMVLAGLLYAVVARVLLLAPWVVREATWRPDGVWSLTLVSGEQVEARLQPSSFVSPILILLNFRCRRWRSCSLVLPPDCLDPDLLRRLRARLRLEGTGDRSDDDALA
jgi:toxin CptA